MADEEAQDIAVKQDKKKVVSEATERILSLFNVVVTLSVESAGIQWVQLKGHKQDTEFAKVCYEPRNVFSTLPRHTTILKSKRKLSARCVLM